MKSSKLQPNFFLAFKICNNLIHHKIKKLQQEIIVKNPSLYSALVNISTLHVTLAVTHLENDAAIDKTKDLLDEWSKENRDIYFNLPFILNFTGIKTFKNIVAYVDIEKCDNYKKLCNISKNLKNLLSSAGFSTDSRRFNPHLTILKLSRDTSLLKKKKDFYNDFEVLKECTDHFGKEEVCQIQLLSMDEPKDENGYYKSFHKIEICGNKLEMDHSECCVPIPKPDTS